jgi:hypothetical protein
MARRTCTICGADVGSAEFSTCGRHACQRAALGPGADDDRQPTRCVHCGLVGSGEICPRCLELLSDIDEPEPEPEPAAPTPAEHPAATANLRSRLLEAGQRREYVWLAGRADLLNRCATFGPMARAQPR